MNAGLELSQGAAEGYRSRQGGDSVDVVNSSQLWTDDPKLERGTI